MKWKAGTTALSLGLALLGGASSNAAAGDLVYTPLNPSFGGNPGYTNHLFATANAQRTATARDADDDRLGGGGIGGGDGDLGNSDVDLFIRQLQGRLLSGLSSQVTEAIFGENSADSGTIQFGDTTIEFNRSLTEIRLTITDASDGTVTEIVVPQLVTNF